MKKTIVKRVLLCIHILLINLSKAKLCNMFEIIAKEDKPKQVDVLMYGGINDWGDVSSRRINSVMNELAQKYDVINARIHSPGGIVFEADAIGSNISKLISQGKTINAWIDGMAASAMADLTTYFSKVFIGRSGRMMVHQARGSVSGADSQKMRDTADLLDSINQAMAERFAIKTGKTKEYILQNWMQSGRDKWFNASQAIAENLVDEIVPDTRKIPEKEKALNEVEIMALYDETFTASAFEKPKPQQKKSIMKEKIIALLALMGFTIASIKADANEDDVFALLEEKTKSLKSENDALRTRVKDSETAEIKALCEEKKLPTVQSDKFLSMVDKIGVQAVKELISTFETPKDLTEIKTTVGSQSKATITGGENMHPDGKAKKDWTLLEWEKYDPSGLKERMKEDEEWYNALFEKEYGTIA